MFDVAFDGTQLVADAGLLLPATLARHLGLRRFGRRALDLGAGPGRANAGDKVLTLVMSALAGGDCIDDANALQAGGTEQVLGFTGQGRLDPGHVPAQLPLGPRPPARPPSPPSFSPGPGRPVPVPARPLTIDLDSTICETYGLKKEGARHHGYTHVRGYHPLLAIAAGTGDVLMARLRGRHRQQRPERRALPGRDDRPGPRSPGPAASSRFAPTAASMPTAWSRSAGS